MDNDLLNEAICQIPVERVADLIKVQDISLPDLFEKVAHEGISGDVTFSEGIDFVSDVINLLDSDDYFETDLHASRALKAAFLMINREYVNVGLYLFPPKLPDGFDRMKYFALPDAALRLSYTVTPKAGIMIPQPGVWGLVFTFDKVFTGWCTLGIRWGTDEKLVWYDRYSFSDLEIVESPVMRN